MARLIQDEEIAEVLLHSYELERQHKEWTQNQALLGSLHDIRPDVKVTSVQNVHEFLRELTLAKV